jgi:hypothetical protein
MMSPRSRSTLPPALRNLTPELDGPLHVGWQRIRAALRGAGLAPGLIARSLHARLGPNARLLPTETATIDLLEGYFRVEARGQLAEGRFFMVREEERLTARRIVARLRALFPELGPLALSEERKGRLFLRTTGAFIEIASEAVHEQEVSHGWVRRTVTVDAIVDAVNRLLRFYDEPLRLLPLASPDGVNAFLAADQRAALLLDTVDLWAEAIEDLDGFAAWGDGGAKDVGSQVA